jgi:hypothetical protein
MRKTSPKKLAMSHEKYGLPVSGDRRKIMPLAEAQRNQLARCPAEEIGLSVVRELSRSVEKRSPKSIL